MSSSDLSRSPPSETASQLSQIPNICSQENNDGRLVALQNSCSVDGNLILINPHADTSYSEDASTNTVEEHGEPMEALQASDHYNDSSTTHLLLQSNNSFIEVSHAAEPGSTHYNKLTKLMDCVCDKLIEIRANNTCIPTVNDKVVRIQQNLQLPSKVYRAPADRDTVETANVQVQQQYDELMKVLEQLSCSGTLRNTIQIEEAYRKLKFPEYVGPYSPYNLLQIIKKINSKVMSQSKCIIL